MPRRAGEMAQKLAFGVLAASLSISAAAADTLSFYTWPSYTSPDVLAAFEAETGIAVTVDIYDSNEQLAAALRAGTPRYDVVVPSDTWVALLAGEGLLMPFDATRLDGFDGIAAPWIGPYFDPGHLYSVPLHWGTTSFVVHRRATGGAVPDTLGYLFEPPAGLERRVGMMTDARDVIDLALRYLDLPACTEDPADLAALEALLRAQQPFVRAYSLDAVIKAMVDGESDVQMLYNGAAMRARMADPGIVYVYPAEGITVWSDNLAIPANAPNRAAAERFLAFLLRPEIIATQSNFTRYGNAIAGSLEHLDPDLRDAPELIIPPGVEIGFLLPCDRAVVDGYEALWTRVRDGFAP